jgi:hypothetical protein
VELLAVTVPDEIYCLLIHFRRVHEIGERNYWLRPICPPARPSAWKNWAPAGGIFMKFNIAVFLENLSRIFKFH